MLAVVVILHYFADFLNFCLSIDCFVYKENSEKNACYNFMIPNITFHYYIYGRQRHQIPRCEKLDPASLMEE